MATSLTPREASELKQRGAIEAAQNAEFNVTADEAQKKIVEESKNSGVAAFMFDANATTEQKRSQARAASAPEGLPKRTKAVAIATDMDDGSKPAYDLPSPSKEGAIAVPDTDTQDALARGPQDADMGERTGWAPRFGWPTDTEGSSLLEHATWLETQLPDKFYGDWYHNAAIIFIACILSWLVAVLGAGLAWLFIIMAICATYYRTSIRRVRRNFKDDITREAALKKLDTDTESLEWINAFLVKFWPIYQPVLAQTVINSVDQVLSSTKPAFLDSLQLRTFTLGSKPPRLEHVKTYPRAEDDVVIMDWKFSFNPNDVADMTSRQLQSKVNPKVVLEIRVGKAMISKGLDVIVEDMAFSGIMQLKIKLQIPFPHVDKIEMSFLERPTIDYVCKPLGGDSFGFDINFIPGLESFILEQIHGNLAPMMYAPNVFPIEVAKLLAGTPVDQAVGVVAITLHGAQGLKNPDNFSGTPDPYAVISLNRREPLAQTQTVKENANPRWNETHYVIVTSFNDSLDIQVYDYNEFRKDKELGVASFSLENLESVHEHPNERLEVIHGGKARGVVSVDFQFFPVLEPTKLPDGTLEELPDTNTGILRYTVEQAKDLDGTKSLIGMLNPFAALLLNGKEVHQTKKLKRTNNPIWDNGSKEILITDRKNAKLGVVVKDDRDITGDQVIGTYQIKLQDMLELMAKGQEWYNLSGAKTGRVKLLAQWKPVVMTGTALGTGGYVTPVGVLRFHFKKATDLRNFETLGKSDPYARVVVSSIERARTVTFKNNLNPEWDEVLYVPIHSAREKLQLEVMDAENMGRDRSLGLVEIFSGDYMHQNEDGEWTVCEKTSREDGLRMHGKGMVKGTLHYTVAFYPTLNVADPDEDGSGEEPPPPSDATKSIEVARSFEPGRLASLGPSSTDKEEPASPSVPKTPTSLTRPLSLTSPRKSRDEKQPPKVYLSPQELLKHESGLVIFRLMEGELPISKTRIELFVDDMAFPSYISSTSKNVHHKFDEIGDCFIRELDFSRLTIKVCEQSDKPDDSGRNHRTIAQLTGNTLDTLKQCLNNPTMLKMKDSEDRMHAVKVSLKYVPVKMVLDPSESINNMGRVQVHVLGATNLPPADSNGKSDPFVKFELNGVEVFKSKTQKKTLNPVFDESFELPVASRTAAKLRAVVWDWDFADKPDYLGGADVNLAQLDPFQAQEFKLALDGKSGTLQLRLLFRPDYVTRTRQGTSTFAGTLAAPTRIVTGVAGAPIKGGVAVAGAVGHGVGKGASLLKRGIMGRKKEDGALVEGDSLSPTLSGSSSPGIPTIATRGSGAVPPSRGGIRTRSTGPLPGDAAFAPPPTPPESATPPGPANEGTPNHRRTISMGASSVHSAMMPGAASGTAVFNVLTASGFSPSSDVYVTITQMRDNKTKVVGKTKHHKSSTGVFQYDETFKVACTPDSSFKIEVKERHTLSSDDVLGEGLLYVDESNAGVPKDVRVGSGTVAIKSSFTPDDNDGSNGHTPPLSSESPGKGSNVRRSFLSKRETRAPPSRDATPIKE